MKKRGITIIIICCLKLLQPLTAISGHLAQSKSKHKSSLKKLWKKGRRMGNKAEIRRQTEEEKESVIGQRNP